MILNKLTRATALLGLAAAMFAGSAHATLVNVFWTGTVTSLDAAYNPPLANGDAASGSFQYDTTATGSGDSTFSIFSGAVTNFSFNINSGAFASTGFSSSGSNQLQVENDSSGEDGFFLLISDAVTAPPLNGHNFSAAGFRLRSSDDTLYSTALNLPTSLNLADFDSRQLFFHFFDDAGTGFGGGFNINLDSLRSETVVPEPATLSLIGMGIAGLGGALRRRRAGVCA